MLHCRPSGKLYIGQTKTSAEKRWLQHLDAARPSQGRKSRIVCAIRKYGPGAFDVLTIGRAQTRDEILQAEIAAIQLWRAREPGRGYNISPGGDAPAMSPDTRDKISKTKLGHPVSADTREKLRQANLGKKASPEARKKMSQARKGKKIGPLSEEHRANIGRALMGKPLGPPSLSHRRRISTAKLGQRRTLTDEQIQLMRKARTRWRLAYRELAALAGVSTQTCHNWMTERYRELRKFN